MSAAAITLGDGSKVNFSGVRGVELEGAAPEVAGADAPKTNERIKAITESLLLVMAHIRTEQRMTALMNVSYLEGASEDFRKGRIDGLSHAEVTLGLLMLEQGIDLRHAGRE
jgi:hypothetical protein